MMTTTDMYMPGMNGSNGSTTTETSHMTMMTTTDIYISGEASSTTQTSLSSLFGDGVNVTTPLVLEENTTWTATGLHTLSSTVTVLPGITLTIGNESLPAAHASVALFQLFSCQPGLQGLLLSEIMQN